jgi:hypothetical protein
MIHTTKIDKSEVGELTKNYYTNIDTPLDDMWENAIIPSADFYTISDEHIIGYFAVDATNTMLQFHLKDGFKHLYANAFEQVLEKHKIISALVATYEPEYLSLCLDNSMKSKLDTILYHQDGSIDITLPMKGLSMDIATIAQLDEVIAFCTNKVGMEGEWMRHYFKAILPKNSVYLFKYNGNIVGAGEMRPSESSPVYANVGVMVSKKFRGKNLGSYILSQMKMVANAKGLKTICSTTVDNIASQKAILKKCKLRLRPEF